MFLVQSKGVNELHSVKHKTILDGWKESTWEIQIDAAEVNAKLLRSKEIICEQQLSTDKQKWISNHQPSQNSLSKEIS